MGENWPGPDNTIGYTGYDYDAVSDLYYAQARYYMPETGRFISEDPWPGTIAEPTTMNPYLYVKNNPLKFVDPSGMVVDIPNGHTEGEYGEDDGDDGGNSGGNSGGSDGSSGGNPGGGNTGGGDTGGTGNDDGDTGDTGEVSRGIISDGIGGAIDGICSKIGDVISNKVVSGTLTVAGGVTQVIAGAALGAAVGWTGIGLVPTGFLMANGAATAFSGVSQILNSSRKTNLPEENVLRTGARATGRLLGGKKGEKVGSAIYWGADTASMIYSIAGGANALRKTGNFLGKTTTITKSFNLFKKPSLFTQSYTVK